MIWLKGETLLQKEQSILYRVQEINTSGSCQLSTTSLEACICINFVTERQGCNVDAVVFLLIH